MLQRREFVLRQLEDDAGSQAVAHHVRHGAEAIPARDTHKQFVTSLVEAKPCMLGSVTFIRSLCSLLVIIIIQFKNFNHPTRGSFVVVMACS